MVPATGLEPIDRPFSMFSLMLIFAFLCANLYAKIQAFSLVLQALFCIFGQQSAEKLVRDCAVVRKVCGGRRRAESVRKVCGGLPWPGHISALGASLWRASVPAASRRLPGSIPAAAPHSPFQMGEVAALVSGGRRQSRRLRATDARSKILTALCASFNDSFKASGCWSLGARGMACGCARFVLEWRRSEIKRM